MNKRKKEPKKYYKVSFFITDKDVQSSDEIHDRLEKTFPKLLLSTTQRGFPKKIKNLIFERAAGGSYTRIHRKHPNSLRWL